LGSGNKGILVHLWLYSGKTFDITSGGTNTNRQ
jgi:hypothetical protein